MQIDWITVSAQIVNFLILVWLLKRFLYQPVIRAMDRREQHIASRLTEVREREENAGRRAQRFQKQSEELDRRRDEILAQAREEAEVHKRQLLDQAREEVAETRTNWQRQTNQEKDEFLVNLRRQVAEAIQAIARKALADLADADLEERVLHTFLERLESLDKESCKALTDTSEPVRIASAFGLSPTQRSRVTRAVHGHLAKGIDVRYTRSPELLCGIELTSGGRRLTWNLADYLEGLTTWIEEAFSPLESRP